MEEKKKRIDELVEIINKASYEYYLNDSPSITDQSMMIIIVSYLD